MLRTQLAKERKEKEMWREKAGAQPANWFVILLKWPLGGDLGYRKSVKCNSVEDHFNFKTCTDSITKEVQVRGQVLGILSVDKPSYSTKIIIHRKIITLRNI